MRMEVIKDQRTIRLWTNKEHSYVLSFKHPKYQTWYVCFSEEWWRLTPPFGAKRIIEFARVIWAK